MAASDSFNCPICNEPLKKIVRLPNKRRVYLCRNCGLRRLLPLPTNKALAKLYGRKKYYTEELFELHNDLTVGYDWKKPIIKLYQKHLREIKLASPQPKRLLEIGCARGVFLDMARSANYQVHGIEANPYAANYARKYFKLSVHAIKFENIKKKLGKFDIIIAYDVLEHVPDPSAFIKKIETFLKPGGLIVLGTPNSSSFLYKIAETVVLLSGGLIAYPLVRFYGRGIEHLSIFNPGNLKALLEKRRLRVVKTYGYSIPLKNMIKVSGIYRSVLAVLAKQPYEFVMMGRKD